MSFNLMPDSIAIDSFDAFDPFDPSILSNFSRSFLQDTDRDSTAKTGMIDFSNFINFTVKVNFVWSSLPHFSKKVSFF